ncbi:MAG: LysM peptidoglycan-binding domain-containing protein [Bacilli bacterium]|nr:LysM peptidoglycan-binding domain-containing protein [Bacilli bacterium]
MKVHIYNKYDTLDKIINQYAISLDELKKANQNLDLFSLKEGDRVNIVYNKQTFKQIENEIPLSNDEFQRYICPHCKQVILIPK